MHIPVYPDNDEIQPPINALITIPTDPIGCQINLIVSVNLISRRLNNANIQALRVLNIMSAERRKNTDRVLSVFVNF